jgi:hypothetical protein
MARRSGTERAGLAALLLLAAAAAQANDSSAEFAAGGLRLARTDAIRMEREDLSIGLDRIAVAYLFRNVTDRDVTLEVAFPLPDIDMNQMSETPHEFHGGRNDGDIFDFRLKIDGKPTVPAFDVHAVSKDGGRDVTGLLHQYRIPLVDDGTPGSDPMTRLGKLDKAAIHALSQAGATFEDDPDRHPDWVVKSAYHWQQRFPARGTVSVEHAYKPVAGSTWLYQKSLLTRPEDQGPPSFGQCYPTQEEAAGVAKLPGFGLEGAIEPDAPLRAEFLGYILSTGANWAGPIGHFRLAIRQGDTDLVSTCPIPGLALKRDGRTLVAEAENFNPASDIKVLYVRGNCKQHPCPK